MRTVLQFRILVCDSEFLRPIFNSCARFWIRTQELKIERHYYNKRERGQRQEVAVTRTQRRYAAVNRGRTQRAEYKNRGLRWRFGVNVRGGSGFFHDIRLRLVLASE